MLKWIASGCLVIVLLVAGVMYFSFRKLSNIADLGPAVTVSVAATPERIFASMANVDSMATWRSSMITAQAGKRGMISVGDTLRERNSSRTDTTVARVDGWVVDTIVPNQLIVMRSLPNPGMKAVRRDSLARVGDSTSVTSSIEMSLPDSIAAQATGPGVGAMKAASRMMVAGSRIVTEMELKKLKAHIEGGPVVRPDSGR